MVVQCTNGDVLACIGGGRGQKGIQIIAQLLGKVDEISEKQTPLPPFMIKLREAETFQNAMRYLVSAIRYLKSSGGNCISHFKVHPEEDGTVGHGSVMDRKEVLDRIKDGCLFVAAFENMNKWTAGKAIKRIKIKNYFFFRTDEDKLGFDHVDGLPTEFTL